MRFLWPFVWRSRHDHRMAEMREVVDSVNQMAKNFIEERNAEYFRRKALEIRLDSIRNPKPFDFAAPLPGWLTGVITIGPGHFEATVNGMGGDDNNDPRFNLAKPMGLKRCNVCPPSQIE